VQAQTTATDPEAVVAMYPVELPRRRWFDTRHILHLVVYGDGRVALIYSWDGFHEELASTTGGLSQGHT
jgi:hypothetical protein